MVELADIVRRAGPEYVHAHAALAGGLLASQRRALDDIAQCRTAAMGGSVCRCDTCGAIEYHYHSCRNRNCPKCQEDRAQDWVARTRSRLLPCDHYLLPFTLPHQLRAVARRHQRVVYAALLREAAAAVQALAADRQWVGGTVGILAVLHTWSRTLEYHPHAHLLVTAGGLSPDGEAWVTPAHARFLMPGYALSRLFRAKLRDTRSRAGLIDVIDPRIWHRRWTVHVQQIGSGEQATLYLSRYVYRVALTNQRLERFAEGRVTFRYTHARTAETRRVTLPADRFLDRFPEHVLPRSFTKVRSYGLLSPGRRASLDRARHLLTTHATRRRTTTSAPTISPSIAPRSDDNAGDHEALAVAAALVVLCLARRCSVCERGQVVTTTLPRHRATAPPRTTRTPVITPRPSCISLCRHCSPDRWVVQPGCVRRVPQCLQTPLSRALTARILARAYPQRRAPRGDLVVWDLILATPNRHHRRWTDWGPGGITNAIIRCDGTRPLERWGAPTPQRPGSVVTGN